MFPIRDINPTKNRPVITYALIAVNVAVFLFELTLDARVDQALKYRFGVVPGLLSQQASPGVLITPLSSMFMHGDPAHLFFNMWYLHVFGDNVEDAMGPRRYLLFFIACGLLAALAQVLVDPSSMVPMVGASGAIFGVLAAYFKLYPNARIQTFLLFIFELPAVVFIIIWFGVQLYLGLRAMGDTSAGGVAVYAHIGGFLAGLLLVDLVGKRRAPTADDPRASRDRV